jgi:adenylate cyclase
VTEASLWTRLTLRGVTASMTAGERRIVVVTNEAALMVTVAAFLNLGEPDARGAAVYAIIIGQALNYALVPVFMGFGWTHFTPKFFSVSSFAWLLATVLARGTDSGCHWFLLAVVMGVWHVVGPTDVFFAGVMSVVPTAAFIAFAAHGWPAMTGATAAQLTFSRICNQAILCGILIGFAAYAFRRTNEAEAALEVARNKSEALLLNVLPASIAQRLKEHEGSIADRFEEATVLFADIVGFTVLSARTPPVELVQMLDQLFSRFDALSDTYGLEKIKTIGDAYMVAAGIPLPRKDHVEAVAGLALDMGRALAEMPGEAFKTLNIRIGIHTGPVVAGVIGQRKFAYDLWGDAVNTASRMESHGAAGKVHVTREVYERLKDRFVFESRGTIEVKGKGELETFFLVGRA